MDGLAYLDYWTEISLEAYWKELVKETQEANLTSQLPLELQETGATD